MKTIKAQESSPLVIAEKGAKMGKEWFEKNLERDADQLSDKKEK